MRIMEDICSLEAASARELNLYWYNQFFCVLFYSSLKKVLRKVQRELYLKALNQSFIYVRKADLPGSGETCNSVTKVLILRHCYLDVPCQRCLSSLCIPSSNYLAWLCFFSWTAEIYYYRAVELGSILQTTVF